MRRVLLLSIDLSVLALATVAALLLRDNLEPSAPRLMAIFPYLGFSVVFGAIVFSVGGLNRSIWRYSGLPDYLNVSVGVAVTVFLAVCVSFVFNRLDGVARSLPFVQAVLAIAVMIGIRVLMRKRREARARPRQTEPAVRAVGDAVLLIGLNTVTEFYLRCAAEYAGENFRVAGILGRSRKHNGRFVLQHPILGAPEELSSVLKKLDVHGVRVARIVVMQRSEDLSPMVSELLHQAQTQLSIEVEMLADKLGFKSPQGTSPSVSPAVAMAVPGTVTMSIEQEMEALSQAAARAEAGLSRHYWVIKRAVDVVVAGSCLVLFAPLIAGVGLLVIVDVGLPAIFWQERIGRFGRPFRLYKFRSMIDAFDTTGQRLLDGTRTSAIGRLLRRTRFDELPQLYNVLIGQMSIVGPRPLLRIDQPSPTSARLLVRPGLTGWAQVNGGRLLSPKDKEALDMWYVCNASLVLDLSVIARTIDLLVFGERMDPAKISKTWLDLNEGPSLAIDQLPGSRRAA